ncbi:MAG: DUF2382 domain-containing protein [Leptolyngbya sp. BL-A-14]
MPLHKIKDFDPDYRNHFEDQDVIGYSLYANNDKIGSVDDILVDDAGKIRYLIVNTGAWIFGKQVLMPIGQAQIDSSNRRIMANNLTRAQVESLPEYSGKPVEYEHEEQVRGVYRPATMGAAATSHSDASAYDRNSYNYDRDPDLYNLDERKHQNLRLYEERLITSKNRAKTGEVAVGKHVETETSRVSVPIEKERVVIERTAPTGAGAAIEPDTDAFRDGEVARVEVYEETPDIRKEAFVREEVSVRKEVDRETKEAEESLRREELDVNTEGRPVVDRGIDTRQSKKRM